MIDKVYNILCYNVCEADVQYELAMLREFAIENGLLQEFEDACRFLGV